MANPGSLRKAVFLLILVFALFAVLQYFTQASSVLFAIDLNFFALANLFFVFSIFVWVFSWAYLIKKHESIRYRQLFVVGFSAVFGSLTPVQVGAEYLRAAKLKELFGISYSESLSASLINKGAKFFILALLGLVVLFLFLTGAGFGNLNSFILIGLFSGFGIVLFACFLFLLPLKHSFGMRLAKIFFKLGSKFSFFKKVANFFETYSNYLERTKSRHLVFVFILALLSWFFEFLALNFTFLSLGISFGIINVLLLLVLIAVLERTPFLPRGIGLVELIGFSFLSLPFISPVVLDIATIGALLIAYDFVRLIMPALLSLGFNFFSRNLWKQKN